MKTLLGAAVVLAGLTCGSNAFANPTIGAGCSFVLDSNGDVGTFNFPTLQKEDVTLSESGNIDANCKVDLQTNQQQTFDNQNTGFLCFLTGSNGVITSTTDWQEVISASGQTTLQCHFQVASPLRSR